jgi:hypothetical protein
MKPRPESNATSLAVIGVDIGKEVFDRTGMAAYAGYLGDLLAGPTLAAAIAAIRPTGTRPAEVNS